MARGTPIEDIIAAYERYGHLGLAAMAVGLKRGSVTQRLKKAGVIVPARRKWQPREDARLRQEYRGHVTAGSVEALALLLDRTHGSVIDRAFRLGLTEARAAVELLGPTDRMEREALTTVYTHPPYVIVTMPGAPVAKARARSDRGSMHTPPRVRNAEERLSAWLATIPIRFDGNVHLDVEFYLKDATRVDEDNLLKLVQDAINDSGLWQDDYQVTKLTLTMAMDRVDPRTHIGIGQYLNPTLPRGTAHLPLCLACGEPFVPAKRKEPPVTCSSECTAEMSLTLL